MEITIVKIGGNIIDDDMALTAFLNNFSAIPGAKILVHGGGKVASELGKKLNLQPEYVQGRRVTDAATLDLVTMVYGGLINKNIVAGLQKAGLNAAGLSGADGNLITAVKRPAQPVDYGFVGDIVQINTAVLSALIAAEITPVICPLTHDAAGQLLNTNADTIASALATALAKTNPVRLLFCFEKSGVLENVEDDATLIESLNASYYQQLKTEEKIHTGMLPKLENAFKAKAAGINTVWLGHANALADLAKNGLPRGTVIMA